MEGATSASGISTTADSATISDSVINSNQVNFSVTDAADCDDDVRVMRSDTTEVVIAIDTAATGGSTHSR